MTAGPDVTTVRFGRVAEMGPTSWRLRGVVKRPLVRDAAGNGEGSPPGSADFFRGLRGAGLRRRRARTPQATPFGPAFAPPNWPPGYRARGLAVLEGRLPGVLDCGLSPPGLPTRPTESCVPLKVSR